MTDLYGAAKDGKGMYIYHTQSQLLNSRDELESPSLPITFTECSQHVSPLAREVMYRLRDRGGYLHAGHSALGEEWNGA